MIQTYHKYLNKRALRPAYFTTSPARTLEMVVVIPSYQEEELLSTLESLLLCASADCCAEVIIVLNDRETDAAEVFAFHDKQFAELKNWCKVNSTSNLHFLPMYHSRLPKKKAGVGLARKLGMDEAIYRFLTAERAGLIIALDADTLVAPNYLQAISAHFTKQPKCAGASIAYAHRLEGLAAQQRRGIVQYELHLRLFLAMKRWVEFPFAFETIGSAMVVRAAAYCRQGGMNTRKAGEDFYFLNKFIPLGHFAEINETQVFPSARISERVPFGTGRAMQSILGNNESWQTYDPALFLPLKKLFANIDKIWNRESEAISDENLQAYLEQEKFSEVLEEIRKNTSSAAAFKKRFFRWFDAFRMMKYLHFCLERGGEKVTVLEAGRWYFGKVWKAQENEVEEEELMLEKMRAQEEIERL